MKGKIEEIKSLEVGLNSGGDPAAWDVILVTEFEDFTGRKEYLEHPLHKEAAAYVNKVRETRASIDSRNREALLREQTAPEPA